MPSRATLLTGHLPHAIESMSMEGTYPGSTYDPARCPFWPAVFRRHGYQTAQIGKWHTGTDTGYGRDWDYQIVWNRPKFPKNAGNYYEDQILTFNGVDRKVDGYSTDNYTRWACEYIRGENRSKDKPWFLWLCYGAVHGPTTPASRHQGSLANKPVPIPADMFGPRPDKPAWLDRSQAWERSKDGRIHAGKSGEQFGDAENQKNRKTFEDWVHQVNECTMALDEGVGNVLQALRESDQLENTIVVYSADQGFGMGEHGFRAKLAAYDANYNSPLIISAAGRIPEGKTCRVPVGGADLVQTFFAWAGLPLPWEMHGSDLIPILSRPDGPHPDRVLLYENMGQKYGSETNVIPADDSIFHGNVPRWIAIRMGHWKYIRTLVEGEMEEIYDVQSDPQELNNLALREEHRSLLVDLRARAISELRRTRAGFAGSMPPTKQMVAGW
jgi:arylsulfatase A-like enzyme